MRVRNKIGFLAILAIVSCSGGAVPDPQVQPDPTTISGTVEITGSPLVSFENPAVIGGQDAKNWSVKLIDPVEDIDSIVIPVANTTFNSTEISTAGEYWLSINLQPAVDLTGGSSATTPVAVSIPVAITAGETTQVFATLEVIAPMIASSVHTASQLSGGRLRLRYTVEAAAKREFGFVEIDWNNHQIRHDTNNDEQFADEEFFADSDRDGISDELRDQMRDRMHQFERFTIEGILAEIDLQHHRVLVGGRWYRVTELTKVWHHTRRVHLGNLEVGQNLSVTWNNGAGDMRYAKEIRILGPMDRPPIDG